MTSDIGSPPATAFRTVGPLRLMTWPALEASGADAAVTARSGGVSSGPYATLNLSLTVGRQVHGAAVCVVGEADRGSGAFSPDDAIGSAGGADALVTASPGVVLAILTADCVPVLLHDPVADVLACVHAGWRGTVAGVTAAAIAAMQGLGSRPSDVIAGLGPAIAADRYQVGPDVHQAVTRAFGSAGFIRPDPSAPGHWLLDLWAANRHALREAGVPALQIHTTTFPTGPVSPAGPGPFFSDRAARPCGRLALIARLPAPGQKPMDVTT